MPYTREQWEKSALKLGELYESDLGVARRQLKNHRHFLYMPKNAVPFVSIHSLKKGVAGGDMAKPGRKTHNIESISTSIGRHEYQQVKNTSPSFMQLWEAYTQICDNFKVEPSGGQVRPQMDRSFFLRGVFHKPTSKVRRKLGYVEGAEKQVTVTVRERSKSARNECIMHYSSGDTASIKCIACNINFRDKYGEIGSGFIHVHHLDPISESQGRHQISPQHDLVPVCPNCHSIIHRAKEPLTIAELVKALKKSQR